jgi:enoyl-CoA hydratase/carnithine racemase
VSGAPGSDEGAMVAGPMVRLEVDGAARVGTIVLDQPPLNMLDGAAWGALAAAVAEVAQRDDVRALLVRGGPRAFAAGADVREFVGLDPDEALIATESMKRALDMLAALPMVTLAVVSGYALGCGCELALACDLRFAADNAKMGQPEILFGAIPAGGGTQRLTRLVGVGRAKDLVFSGRMVDMVEAQRIGLVDAVHPVDDVVDVAFAAATRFAAGPAALALAKRAIDEGLDGTLEEGLRLERELFAAAFATDDLSIGVTSFLADGPGVARFTGR